MNIDKKQLYEMIRKEIITETHDAEYQKAINLLRDALGILASVRPEAALKLGPLITDLDNYNEPEVPGSEKSEFEEDDYEASLRRRYDKEEAAARREGPSTPLSPEESAALWDDDENEEY